MKKQMFTSNGYQEIDTLRWPAMPDPKDLDTRSPEVWIWQESRIRAFVQCDPSNAHGDGYLVFPFALAVFDQENRHILTAALQQTDFRTLALMTGERLRDLKGDTKGYLSPVTVCLYAAEGHDDLGLYEEGQDRDAIIAELLEVVADKLDLWEDPIRKNWF
ncbi:MAG: hypothetical protein PHR10_07495 [Sphaerochaetaceae bacterium]|jgi:hypothetical protein|nr:hypothetical protein [Sphaerochaetaceae bacterium]MDY0371054.1 hypothetical protein [Sphaerochaetaceae bacterium]